MLVSLRDSKSKKVIAAQRMTGYMGPTYTTNWIMRQAAAAGYKSSGFEFRIGEKGPWTPCQQVNPKIA